MKTITYRVTLHEPTLVTSLQGDPNSAVAHDYLPGSVLRGVLVSLAMRYEGKAELDAADPRIRRLFFDHSTRFLNGYVGIDYRRSLPVPRSWEQDKHASPEMRSQITDRALVAASADDRPGKPKSLGGGFCIYTEGTADAVAVKIAEPKHVINVHTERDRASGRARGDGRGTVYRYDALAAGQSFEAAILCDEAEDAEYLKTLLTGFPVAAIGGARSAGYGRVAFSDVHIGDAQREVAPDTIPWSDRLILTLLSDVLLTDQYGQPASDVWALRDAVAARLGVDAAHLGEDASTLAFRSTALVGGFNRKWGLPLRQTPVLSMGSVFVFEMPNLGSRPDTLDALERLEWIGIGERRAEGFGRVAANWQLHSYLQNVAVEPVAVASSDVDNHPAQLSTESQAIWDGMMQRINRKRSDVQIMEQANALSLSRELPPSSQLNRLRQQVLGTLLGPQPDAAVVTDFLNDIRGKRASQHFEQARVAGKRMSSWLEEQVNITDSYTALRLIDAVLARAAKQGKRQNGRLETDQ
ncbi:MAG: hypothetical protein IT323_20450 [Anaerolineae bacterium]|nr:hypothetical protein [Anaerolineae bacterium]